LVSRPWTVALKEIIKGVAGLVDDTRKRRAESVLRKLGVTPAQAINMLYAQIELRKGLPFMVTERENSDLLPSDGHYDSVMRRNDE
jgi:addiction module RelB/DinJ family antitoxin